MNLLGILGRKHLTVCRGVCGGECSAESRGLILQRQHSPPYTSCTFRPGDTGAQDSRLWPSELQHPWRLFSARQGTGLGKPIALMCVNLIMEQEWKSSAASQISAKGLWALSSCSQSKPEEYQWIPAEGEQEQGSGLCGSDAISRCFLCL